MFLFHELRSQMKLLKFGMHMKLRCLFGCFLCFYSTSRICMDYVRIMNFYGLCMIYEILNELCMDV